ncbi:peptidylprolyl isomerase [Paracoccus spongiarum]|uniref:Parvulin-like PPIase n=1 Tax=Paracoccus spongiarum TaxID=3064387 RepID=A0ABT9JDW5_9RHOB|nr:peptidylprolyl isomerase [Paracoccus sp. 2205BS29-5]MDP5307292.1 peptidylprolyl isomerase [Paracoccus sp. 2205BS29-5]
MLKTSILALLVAAAPLIAPAAALAQDKGADTVVATVNGQTITLGQMIVMKQSVQDPQMAGLPDQALWDMMLDQLIRQTAVAETGAENAGVRAQLELQRRNTLATAAVTQVAEAEPTEAEITATYEKLFASTDPVTEYSAAHILVETEEAAKAVKAQLDEGADFGTLAEERSTGPSGPNKGDLGWFSADQMVPPFAEAVKAMEKGAISDPVKTDFGWHVIKLNDTRLREAPPLDEVRDQVAQMVRRDKVEAEIERVMGEAKVEKTEGVDPSLMNQTDLLEAE